MAKRSFVFGHLADAHIGAWARDAAIRRALRESVLRALDVVQERRCEFLLISGDLFHTPVPDPAEAAPVAAKLRSLTAAGVRIYVIYGSHDYVAHRTSWLDVLAETGIFLRAAPEPVRVEGSRWTLPFLIDGPTGAAIAGISGRALGLDRTYFSAVDSEAFRAHPGFRIFQFHAAVEEYLPPAKREHIPGVRRDDLPAGCDYYAGGHIHWTYQGEGPGGGLLVNPGAVFGTSRPDIEAGVDGRTHQGVAIVTVDDGRPSVEFVDTAPRGELEFFDVDVSGQSVDEAKSTVRAALAAKASSRAILFPRLKGSLREGSIGSLGLNRSVDDVRTLGVEGVRWELPEVRPIDASAGEEPEAELLTQTLRHLREKSGGALPEFSGEDGEARLRELVQALGLPIGDGEGREDYESGRVDAALRLLGRRVVPAE